MRSSRRGANEAAADYDPAKAGAGDGTGPSASKRARVDHGEQVKALFGAKAPVVFD